MDIIKEIIRKYSFVDNGILSFQQLVRNLTIQNKSLGEDTSFSQNQNTRIGESESESEIEIERNSKNSFKRKNTKKGSEIGTVVGSNAAIMNQFKST